MPAFQSTYKEMVGDAKPVLYEGEEEFITEIFRKLPGINSVLQPSSEANL